MTNVTRAYAAGAQAAMGHFSVRLASARTPMSADRLARMLSDLDERPGQVGVGPTHRKLEKPPIWGPVSSVESGTTNARNYSGIGAYGGV